MDLDLLGKNALVCGSTQGIGKATALALAKMGATVFLLARNEEKLIKVKSQLDNSKGQKHDHLCCLLYTSPSPRDLDLSRMPSSA